jgi:hypothetical protein
LRAGSGFVQTDREGTVKAANSIALALAISLPGGRVGIAAEDAASTTHPAHHDHRVHHRIPAVREQARKERAHHRIPAVRDTSGAGASVNK